MANTSLLYGLVAIFLGQFLGESQACICTRDYNPVCGTNLVTYGNECMLECASSKLDEDIDVLFEGRCDDVGGSTNKKISNGLPEPVLHSTCICPHSLMHVCATSGFTYANKCHLKCAGAELGYEGPCKSKKPLQTQ